MQAKDLEASYIFARPSGAPATCHENSKPKEPLLPQLEECVADLLKPSQVQLDPAEPQFTHRPTSKSFLVEAIDILETFIVIVKAATKKKRKRGKTNIKFISLHKHKIYLQGYTRI